MPWSPRKRKLLTVTLASAQSGPLPGIAPLLFRHFGRLLTRSVLVRFPKATRTLLNVFITV